ncbi:hypothetical protein N9O88_01020 [bacterium]|nr:hypothetical protein [bacterium]
MPRYTRRRYGGADQVREPEPKPQVKSYFQKMKEKGSAAMGYLSQHGMNVLKPGLNHLHAAAREVADHAYGEAAVVGTQATGMAKNAAKGAITTGKIAAQTGLRTIPLSSTGGKKYNTRKYKRYTKRGGKSRKSKSRRSTKTHRRSRKYRR